MPNLYDNVTVTDRQQTIDGEEVPTWVNLDCPDRCSTHHDDPEPNNMDGRWQCPETGVWFTLNYSPTYGVDEREWVRNDTRWGTYASQVVRGEWLIEPYEYGLECCNSCGEWTDDHVWSDYYGAAYCIRHDPEEYDEYDDEYYDNSRGSNYNLAQCHVCRTVLGDDDLFLDENTEHVYCSQHSMAGHLHVRRVRNLVAA